MTMKKIFMIASELGQIEGELEGYSLGIDMTGGDVDWRSLSKSCHELSLKLREIRKEIIKQTEVEELL